MELRGFQAERGPPGPRGPGSEEEERGSQGKVETASVHTPSPRWRGRQVGQQNEMLWVGQGTGGQGCPGSARPPSFKGK